MEQYVVCEKPMGQLAISREEMIPGVYPRTCVELLEEKQKNEFPTGEILKFDLGEDAGKDVYNSSSLFWIGSTACMCARVEPRKNKCGDSQVVIFMDEGCRKWKKHPDSPIFSLEDGFVADIGGVIVVGGVKAYPKPTADDPDRINYYTLFYRMRDIANPEPFARGPDGMKDIRLALLPNGRIAVFTRPQGKQPDGQDCERGKIGYIEIENLDELNSKKILQARIIESQFAPGEWGGANELYPFPDGRIGVLGHIAYIDAEGSKHYYAMVFVYDPETYQATPIKIIATREDFPEGEAKARNLKDVVFPAGMELKGEEAVLRAGLSDAQVAIKVIFNPFRDEMSLRK